MLNYIRKCKAEGIPLRVLNQGIAGVVILLVVLIFASIIQTFTGFESFLSVSNRHTTLRLSSYELQIASDYLTEQARCFAVCGDREHLDNYFEEANVSKRRDKALSLLQQELGDTEPYLALQKAMNQSITLMETEYYSMRLAIEGRNEDLSSYPEIIQAIELREEDRNLSDAEKTDRARSLVFDDNYHLQKKIISENMEVCLRDLDRIADDQEQKAASSMKRILLGQGILIAVLAVCVLFGIFLNTKSLIHPIARAVERIQSGKLLNVEGAREFRYLAQTYNKVFNTNQEQSVRLAYEASHDKLTGLSNRSSFDLMMDNAAFQDCALLLIDVDHFKNINDSKGHHQGDKALQSIGQIIRKSFRDGDYVFRIGGDEFAVILQHVSSELKGVIENKVALINKKLEKLADEDIKTTISAGVTFGTGNDTPEVLYCQADRALYQAKRSGRKCCVFYEDEPV